MVREVCGVSRGCRQSSNRHKRGLRPALGTAAAAVLALLLGPHIAAAGSLQIGAGSTMQLGDAELRLGCNDLLIAASGTLEAQASTIRLAGNWDNQGTFDAGTGAVVFEDGCSVPGMSNIDGSTTFFDLTVVTSTGKTVKFGAGSTQTILNNLTLTGAPGNLLVIRSSMSGQQAFLNLQPGGTQTIDYVDVADNGASGRLLAPGSPQASHSIDSGNNSGWFAVFQRVAPVASGIGLLVSVLMLLALGRIGLQQWRGAAVGTRMRR